MQHWLVPSWHEEEVIDVAGAVRLVSALGVTHGKELAGAMLDTMRQRVRVHHCSVLCFEGERNPRLLSAAGDEGEWHVRSIVSVYARDHFHKDPLHYLMRRYTASFEQPTVIVHRQCVADIEDADYRLACYEGVGIVERASVLIRTGRSQSLCINFYRDQAAGLYSDADMARLIGLAPLLAACASRQYALDTEELSTHRGAVPDDLAEICPRLTLREREVVQRILDGATTDRIADELSIRPNTVMTYRARAYEKMGVGTRRELFAALLTRRNVAHPPAAMRR